MRFAEGMILPELHTVFDGEDGTKIEIFTLSNIFGITYCYCWGETQTDYYENLNAALQAAKRYFDGDRYETTTY